MIKRIWIRGLFRLVAGAITAAMLASAPIIAGTVPAQAQPAVSEFRVALEPYGEWMRHARWGEVWVPFNVSRNWRPYTVGRWVHTDEWGWYWVSADSEADWGWITYHYGRWVFDRELGWVWIARREWGPAWVQWRRGATHIGWAPLPPDEIVAEYYDEPEVWTFVRGRDFASPRLVSVILPVREYHTFIRDTVVVNRSVLISERGPAFAVNPGIAPAIVAAAVGRPLRNFDVRPRVLAGTAQIRNAVEVRSQDLRQGRRERAQVTVRETQTTIRPAQQVPRPQPLAARERGRLSDTPPRAALGVRDREQTTGQAPAARQEPKQPSAAERRKGKQPPMTEGRGAPKQIQPPAAEQRLGAPKQPPVTEGRGTQRQQMEPQRQPPAQSPTMRPPSRPPATEGRGFQQQLPPRGLEGRGAPQQQQRQPATEGRGTQRQQIGPQRQPPAVSPAMRPPPSRPPATEGRGVQQQSPQRGLEGRGAPQQRPQATEGRGAPRQAPATEGRGGPQRQPGGRGQQKEAR